MATCILFCCLGTTDRKETELHSLRQNSDSRTAAACDGRLTTYGLRFRRANTFWKDSVVYIDIYQTSSKYHVGADRNHHFGAETFSANGAATPYFGPLGRVSC
jgi:hypothetical protein